MRHMRGYFSIIMILICMVSLQAAVTHHYRLDETFQHEALADSAGGEEATSTTLIRGKAGMVAGAVELSEADNDCIDLGANNALLPAGDFTITAWVQASSDGFDENERILDCSNGDAFGSMSTGFNLKSQDGGLRVFIGDGATKVYVGTVSAQLSVGSWYLVSLRYQKSSNPGIANDGIVTVTAMPFSNALVSATDAALVTDSTFHKLGTIGSATHLLAGTSSGATQDAGKSFDGLMDDIRIYDSYLSDQDIAVLYNEQVSVVSCLRWIFNVDGDKEGWTAFGVSSDLVSGGDYVITSAGGETQILSPDNLSLDLTGIDKVYVKAQNSSDATSARVCFQTELNPLFSDNLVDFPIIANESGYTVYEVDMAGHANWTGRLKRLRIDLPGGALAGDEIRFDRIAVGASGNRPNVIVMMADDLGWRDVTVNGSGYYNTPNVDRLAEMGVNFPNAYSANPLCSPTRAAIVTGLYPAHVRFNTPAGHSENVELDPGVMATANSYLPSTTVGSRTRLPNGYVTYAERLKHVGYSTAFIGKWHLGRDEYIPENQGFDFVIGGREHAGPPGGYFAPFSSNANIPSMPDGSPIESGEHVNDILAAWAADFIQTNRNKPFLMNMWWYDVHGPFEAKADVRAKYVGQSDAEGRQDSPTMAAMIEVMDDGVGVIIDQLEDLGLIDDTVIFFTGDNGGWMYSWIDEDLAVPTDNYPSRAGKACIWDGGSHVPFIVSWPGIVTGGTVNINNVNNMDIYATILDMLDLEPYDGYSLDSTTLVPSLTGQAPANEDIIFVQFPQAPPATGTFPGVWVRQGDMKLIRFFHGNGGQGNHRYELYNIVTDPGEETNLADENPALVSALDALIEQHLNDTEALVPVANPNYVPPLFSDWKPNYGVWVQDGSNGYLKMVSNSFLPALDSPDLSAQPAPATVRVQMTSRSYGDGRIWWKLPGDAEWTLSQSVSFPVTHDNVERMIEIALNPGGSVQQIRFQPSTGYFETDIKDITILDADNNVIGVLNELDSDGDGKTDAEETVLGRDSLNALDMAFDFNRDNDFEGWSATNNITNVGVSGGMLSGFTTTHDPILSRTGLGFAGNEVSNIYLKMKAESSGIVQFFWGRQGADVFSAARRLDLQYTGAGHWETVHIPTSSSALAGEWNNQTITRMRIDPIGIADMFWEIDWIRASSVVCDPPLAGDVAGPNSNAPDCVVDLYDLQAFAAEWLISYELEDIASLALGWLDCTLIPVDDCP